MGRFILSLGAILEPGHALGKKNDPGVQASLVPRGV